MGFSGMDLLGEVHSPLALARWVATGGAIFMIKLENIMRHNEIHVIVMIFITANCFSPLDV